MTTLLFVYGTLKRGLSNHHFLAGQRFVGEAKTQPIYRIHHLGWHPGMVEMGEGGLEVEGEIFEVDEASLSRMDAFEEVPEHFVRRTVRLQGELEGVDAYFYNRTLQGNEAVSNRWPFDLPTI